MLQYFLKIGISSASEGSNEAPKELFVSFDYSLRTGLGLLLFAFKQ